MTDVGRDNAKILEYFGWELQKNKLFEELSELIIAIAKKQSPTEILSEVADCYNMLAQTCMHYGFSRGMIENEMERKCNRTLNRIYEDTEM